MKLLIPSDLSKNAKNALLYTNSIAKAIKGKLILQNIYTPSMGGASPISGIVAEETAIAMNINQKELNKLRNKYITVASTLIIERGEPVNKILSAAESNAVDLIVMGTHGASGLAKTLFGSNTAKVVLQSNVPVLAINQNYKYKKVNTIVYASDLKNVAKELKCIIPLAKKLNATIEVLNFNFGRTDEKVKKAEVEKKIKGVGYKKIKVVEQKANFETLIDQIRTYVKKRKPQMLALFPEDRAWYQKVFGNGKTEDLAYKLEIPLLSIRKSIVK